jgi:flagellar hook assembly protein FlgD
MPRKKVDAAAVVFALLVLATVAAFAYAQRVKRDPLLVDRVEIGTKKSNAFTPKGRCDSHIRLKFRTTTSNEATVEIIRPGGELVRTPAKHAFLKRYSYHVFHWDGKNQEGVIQPQGRYRMRVLLEDEGRELTLPGTIRLEAAARGSC